MITKNTMENLIFDKKLLKQVLNNYIEEEEELEVKKMLTCVNFDENILNSNLDYFEEFEIFAASILNLHLEAIEVDDFELANLVMLAYLTQKNHYQKEILLGEDKDTINWLYWSDDYVQNTVQLQLNNYNAFKK